MAKVDAQRFKRETYPKDAPAWLQTLLEELTEFSQENVGGALDRRLSFTENFQAELKTVRLSIPDVAFIAPTLGNSWANFGSGYRTAGYRIGPTGRVELRGLINGGTISVTSTGIITTLPVGYRPSEPEPFVTLGNGTAVELHVKATGDVHAWAGASNVAWSLNGITFQAVKPCAPPRVFSGEGWPVRVKHGLPDVGGAIPVLTRLVDAVPGEAAPDPELDLATGKDGELLVRAAHGLSPGRVYLVTLLLFVR